MYNLTLLEVFWKMYWYYCIESSEMQLAQDPMLLSSHHILGTASESWYSQINWVHHGASHRIPPVGILPNIGCVWYVYGKKQPTGVMNVDDEHPLELVEQLEFRPSTSRKPSSRTPFDWDIQGRGHLLRFPKDPYGTGALGSTRLNVQPKGLNRGTLVAAWLKINIKTKGNNMLIQIMPDPTTNANLNKDTAHIRWDLMPEGTFPRQKETLSLPLEPQLEQ